MPERKERKRKLMPPGDGEAGSANERPGPPKALRPRRKESGMPKLKAGDKIGGVFGGSCNL